MPAPLPDGYSLPLCTALTQPILIAGVPRGFAIFAGTLTAALVMALHYWLFGSITGFALYAVGRYITSRDAFGFQCWARHLRQPSIYEA